MTLSDKLAARIAQEDSEIARISTAATADVAAARRRKTILKSALTRLTAEPELETLLASLTEVGVDVRGK